MPSAKTRLLALPKIEDSRGSLGFVEAGSCTPFEIRRVFFIYDVPSGAVRAGHALRTCDQMIVAVTGAFDVISDDGHQQIRRRLASADCGLFVPALTWLQLEDFTPGAVCLVFASEPYDEAGYVRDHDEFRRQMT